MIKDIMILFIGMNIVHFVVEYIYSIVKKKAFKYNKRNFIIYFVFALFYVFLVS